MARQPAVEPSGMQSSAAIQRFTMWALQALLVAAAGLLWSQMKDIKGELYTELRDVKIQQVRIAERQNSQAEKFVQVEAQTGRYGADISDMRTELRQISASINELRLMVERGRK